ncbi:hypothetical protein QAD02_021513 [Eretmocerus hayati]|uniref:Uncharacterized protein n=1 Tax=Eretmocerus hayati TaxID=131215 RepID=A0ACC2PQ48_9HYME|nr:hypothetical protein QAD02_021513 [Eretmocerus hayati]
MSVHTDSDIADQSTRKIPQAEYDHKSSNHERTYRVAEILPDAPLETIGIPIVESAAVSVNQNSEMQNRKLTEYSHTLSEVPEPMKAKPKITNIEVMKSPKIKFRKPEITVISEKSKFTGDPAENPRVKNQGYWLNFSMINSDGNGVSGSGGPIKLSYDVPSRQRDNEQKIQRQVDDIEPRIKLRSDKSTISVRDNDTIRGEPTIVHQIPESAAGYSQ